MLQLLLPLATALRQETTPRDIPMPSTTVLLLLFFGFVFIVAWRLLANRSEIPAYHAGEPHSEAHAELSTRAAALDVPAAIGDLPAVSPDNLTLIEGIGPKINQILNDNSIHTFAELAETSPEFLSHLLRAHRIPGVTVTWPEQARLASLGDWEALKTLQQNLTAGRRA